MKPRSSPPGYLACLGFAAAWLALIGASRAGSALPDKIDYNRDVRPIFSDNCFACHGPDKNARKSNLRLDTKDGAFAALKSGKGHVVAPGKPDESEVYRRISTKDADDHMPPAKFNKTLTERQIAIVRKWIEQGAEFKGHWAYLPIHRPAIPTFSDSESAKFVRGPIDALVLAKLKEAELPHAPQADRVTLIRRLYFDLIGLPPTKAQVDAFVNDKSGNAYETVVDQLLASPHFGERMAVFWLDLVRYADSAGYHSDNPIPVSPFRDYVIKSFNDNTPFDRFTIEQLAGDLLPDATMKTRIASAYNRLLQTTEEGGAQPREYENKYAADRVRNFSTVWLAQTMGCAECHDHKFDPTTTHDFYTLEAFFADVQEPSVGNRGPGTPILAPEQEAKVKGLDSDIARIKSEMDARAAEVKSAQAEWEKQPRDEKLPDHIKVILAIAADARNNKQRKELSAYYHSIAPLLAKQREELAKAEKQKDDIVAGAPHVLISISGPPRVVRVRPRGNWQDDSQPPVEPAIPAFLGKLDAKGRRASRLDLARWLVRKDNPLTARVLMNRVWKLLFGRGLAQPLDDLGLQGELPSNPELLDYLAADFIDHGWDVKRAIRNILLSSAYRQSSRPTPQQLEADPFNKLVARQGRFRLDAEFVRDNALFVSGLLVDKIGGPSVKPYQPAGYWFALNFPPREWENDKGEGLYRRGLYTWWQRSFLHPSLLAFDAPTREEATCERPRSNIPQQALALLNDPTYVEAARVLAEKIIREGGSDPTARIQWTFGRVLSREATPEELQILSDLFAKHSANYSKDVESARALITSGAAPVPKDLNPSELAAWTSVARAVLNLHETISRY